MISMTLLTLRPTKAALRGATPRGSAGDATRTTHLALCKVARRLMVLPRRVFGFFGGWF